MINGTDLRRSPQQLPQTHFLQLLLLRGADVEERRDNVGEQAKEGHSKGKRQEGAQLGCCHSCDADELEEKSFWLTYN